MTNDSWVSWEENYKKNHNDNQLFSTCAFYLAQVNVIISLVPLDGFFGKRNTAKIESIDSVSFFRLDGCLRYTATKPKLFFVSFRGALRSLKRRKNEFLVQKKLPEVMADL